MKSERTDLVTIICLALCPPNCTHTHRHTDRHADIQTHRHTQRHTDRHRQTDTDTDRHTHTDTHTHRHTQTHTHTHTPLTSSFSYYKEDNSETTHLTPPALAIGDWTVALLSMSAPVYSQSGDQKKIDKLPACLQTTTRNKQTFYTTATEKATTLPV